MEKESQQVFPFEKLPDTCLLHIFHFLKIKDRCNAARVSRRWNKLARSPTHLDLDTYSTKIHLPSHPNFWRAYLGNSLKSLKVSYEIGISNGVLDHLSKNCPQLEELDIDGIDLRTIDPAKLPSGLTSLTLDCPVSDNFWKVAVETGKLTSMQKLHISCRSSRGEEIMNISARPMPNLTSLALQGFKLEPQKVTQILDVCTFAKLRYLDISGNFLSNNLVRHLAGNLTNLKYLRMTDWNWRDVVVKIDLTPLKSLEHLTELDLKGFSGFKRQNLIDVVNSMPWLEELTVSRPFRSSDLSKLRTYLTMETKSCFMISLMTPKLEEEFAKRSQEESDAESEEPSDLEDAPAEEMKQKKKPTRAKAAKGSNKGGRKRSADNVTGQKKPKKGKTGGKRRRIRWVKIGNRPTF